jgi:hypothetical protein
MMSSHSPSALCIYTNPIKEVLTQKAPTDFGQGVAAQEWHPFQVARTQYKIGWDFPEGRGLKKLTLRCANLKEHHYSCIHAP